MIVCIMDAVYTVRARKEIFRISVIALAVIHYSQGYEKRLFFLAFYV